MKSELGMDGKKIRDLLIACAFFTNDDFYAGKCTEIVPLGIGFAENIEVLNLRK